MSNIDLQKLVHEYRAGFIPRDIYLIRRREIIDQSVGLIELAVGTPLSADNVKSSTDRQSDLKPVQSFSKVQITFAAVLGVFVIAIAGFLIKEIFVGSKDDGFNDAMSAAVDNQPVEASSQSQLFITLLDDLTRSSSWRPDQIAKLTQQWSALPGPQQADVKMSREWQLFIDQVLDALPKIKTSAEAGNESASQQLVEIDRFSHSVNVDFDSQLSGPPVEVAQLETSKKKQKVEQQARAVPSVKSKPSAFGVKRESKSIDNTNLADSSAENTSETVAQAPGQESGTSSALSDNQIDKKESANSPGWASNPDILLSTFKNAMENGDVNKIVSMFAENGSYLSVESKPAIQRTLNKLISNTKNRKVDLTVDSWSKKDDFITGVGRYKLQSDNISISEQRIINSDLKIVLASTDNELKIAAFDIFNKDVIANPIKDRLDNITNAELKSLMSTFVKAYEKGDIEELVNLFSDKARTNDQSDKQGVIKDYSDLFDTTSKRNMYVKNVQWDINNNIGKGNSEFVVLVTPVDTGVEQTFKGKFNIVVEKTDKGTLITQFFHSME